jgi:DeoR/GlpR family transcriptional regulator of sugar metabolism
LRNQSIFMHLRNNHSLFSVILTLFCTIPFFDRLNSFTNRSYWLSQGAKIVQNHERRSRLIDIIRIQGFAALEELVRELGVSESTVRRDLDALEEQGIAKRTHGGVLYSGGMPRLTEFDDRQPTNWAAKRAIAVRAAEIIDDGETVLLDGGTTTYEVARLLVGRSLQVVTNSLPVANLFASESRTDLVLLGGYVSPRTGVCLGPYANELLSRLHVTTTVLSAAGISREGLFNAHLLLAETEQAMLRAAGRCIVVADSSKFGRKSLTLVAGLEAVNAVVSDDGLSQEWRDFVAQTGGKLVIAEVPPEAPESPTRPLRKRETPTT